MASNATDKGVDSQVARISSSAREQRFQVTVAESLTGGQLATALAAGEASQEWFRGGIVAYQPEIKYDLLRTPVGPVVTAATAKAMAASALSMFHADFCLAVTGVGGPEPSEGKPAGTVFIALAQSGGTCTATEHHFEGEPIDILNQTIRAALAELESAITPVE